MAEVNIPLVLALRMGPRAGKQESSSLCVAKAESRFKKTVTLRGTVVVEVLRSGQIIQIFPPNSRLLAAFRSA